MRITWGHSHLITFRIFPMRALFTSLFLSLVLALPVSAQTRETASTILVLDASGSMWGQIDGVNKILIARQVIGELLPQLPADMALGLTMYGHNRRGDCSDIETVVAPGLNNRDQIARIVNNVNPRGRTPLSGAVIQAAEQLRHTENPATVILVSDGRETCEMDPCAVGRMLEETGIDFTAHVIGFDVAEPADIAQLQCLADNTGGQFFSASNAAELSEALTQVTAAPAMSEVTLRAVVGPERAAPTSPLLWQIFGSDGAPLAAPVEAPSILATLAPGDYRVAIDRLVSETEHGGTITVAESGPQEFIFELPPLVPDAGLTAPEEAPVGTTVPVQWTGPGEADDYILLANADRSASFVQVFPRDGNPLMVTLPDAPGDYLLQYVDGDGARVLAETGIRAIPNPATLDGPQSGVAGSTHSYDWTGPATEGDWIGFYRPGNTANHGYDAITGVAEVIDGEPRVELRLPPDPGRYELRYIAASGREMLARLPVEITPAPASVQVAAPGTAGAQASATWTGPGYPGDWIGFYNPDNTANHGYDAITRQEVTDGQPRVALRYPPEPGTYELRYVMELGRTVLARQQVQVQDVQASLNAPVEGVAGSEVEIDWTGPANPGDWIGFYNPDNTANHGYDAITRQEISDGQPTIRLRLPPEPGRYELRYIMDQGRRTLAARPFTVTEVSATLEAPSEAIAGDT
ncbi:VWA domain-containing protein, partial [Rhodobacteraceae bacterium W635]